MNNIMMESAGGLFVLSMLVFVFKLKVPVR